MLWRFASKGMLVHVHDTKSPHQVALNCSKQTQTRDGAAKLSWDNVQDSSIII